MPMYQSRLKADGAKLIETLKDETGGSTSAIIAAIMDYLALYKNDEVVDFILHRVAFHGKGFRIKRKS